MGAEPVEGKLVFLDTDEIAIAHSDERAGNVVVHFPRVGYDLSPV